MSYRIVYSHDAHRMKDKPLSVRKHLLTCMCFFIFLVCVHFFWEEGSHVLRRIMFPLDWNAAKAVEAFSDMLHQGTPLWNTLQVFREWMTVIE